MGVSGAVLALAVLVGCQGGEASDGEPSTSHDVMLAYHGSTRHPVVAVSTDPMAGESEAELERLINDYRTSRGLPGLRVLSDLKDLALAHSVHMGLHEPAFFDHLNPEGDLPEARAKDRIAFQAIGENIAAGQSAADLVFRSWLDSPGHRANLEDPRWTHMGAGHAVLPDTPYVTYWTMNFVQQ